MATLAATPTRSLSIPAHWRARIGYLALLGVLAYLVVLPMIRLQSLAFEDGAQGYRSQYGRYRHRRDHPDHDRARGRVAGDRDGARNTAGVRRQQAAGEAGLPAGHTDPAYRHARDREHRRLGLPAFARARLPQRTAQKAAVVERVGHRARSTSTRFRGSSSSPASVSRRSSISSSARACRTSVPSISRPHRSAGRRRSACSSGSSCPLLRPSLIYGGGIALLLGLGQFTGPLLLGQNSGVKVLTTEMYRRVSESPADFAAAAAAGSPLVIFGLVQWF